MSIVLDPTNGITAPMYGGAISANAVTPSVGMKNRIINGAMVIDQRNAGASVTATTTGVYTVDRWGCYSNPASKFTVQQDSSANTVAGFTSSLKIVSSSAYTPSGTDLHFIYQSIEGYNVADLGYGTSSAKTVTLSFWVRSSLTGNFGAVVGNGTSWTYPFLYTINSANTWEQKSVTISGQTSGTWAKDNSTGFIIRFSMGCGTTYSAASESWTNSDIYGVTGQTQVVGTSGATWYLTGVQLEVGSSATAFDYRPYGTELQLCQRYFQQVKTTSADGWVLLGATNSTTGGQVTYNYVVPPRVPATGISVSAVSDFGAVTPGNSNATCTALAFSAGGSTNVQINFTCPSSTFSASVPQVAYLYRVNNGYIQFTGMEL